MNEKVGNHRTETKRYKFKSKKFRNAKYSIWKKSSVGLNIEMVMTKRSDLELRRQTCKKLSNLKMLKKVEKQITKYNIL
jgi:hypothetical protein